MDVIEATFQNPDGSPGAPPAYVSWVLGLDEQSVSLYQLRFKIRIDRPAHPLPMQVGCYDSMSRVLDLVIYVLTYGWIARRHLHITNSTSHLNLVADKPVITHPTHHLHINSTVTNSMSHLRESLRWIARRTSLGVRIR